MTADDKGGLATKLRELLFWAYGTEIPAGYPYASKDFQIYSVVSEVIAALEAKDIEGDHKLAARVRNAIKCISSEGQNDRIHEGDLKVLRRAADELDRLPVKVAKDIELEGLRKAVRKACIQIIGKGSFREVELVDGGTWKEREKAIGEWKDWNIGWTVIPIEILEKLIAAATATSKEWHRKWTLS
jgi:hypothetical protein